MANIATTNTWVRYLGQQCTWVLHNKAHIQHSGCTGGLTLESSAIERKGGSSFSFTISSDVCEGTSPMEEE